MAGSQANRKKQNTGSKKTSNSGKTGTQRKSSKNVGKQRSNNASQKAVEATDSFLNEGVLLCTFAAAIFLTFSNFKLCGEFGNIISSFFFGIFGVVQYVVPVYVLIVMALLMVNQYHKRVVKKVVYSFVILLLLCTLCQMVSDISVNNIVKIYGASANKKTGGGILGGLICMPLHTYLNTFGTWILVLVLLFVFIMLIAEKSLFDIINWFRNMTSTSEEYAEYERKMEPKREPVRQVRNSREVNVSQIQRNANRKAVSDAKRQKAKREARKREIEQKQVSDDGAILDRIVVMPSSTESLKKQEKKQSKNTLKSSDVHEIYSDAGEKKEKEVLRRGRKKGKKKPDIEKTDILMENEIEPDDLSNLSITGMVETTATMMDPEAFLEASADPVSKEKRQKRKSEVSKKDTVAAVEETKKQIEEKNREEKQQTSLNDTYEFPKPELLNAGKKSSGNNEQQMRETARKLQETLHTFGVNVTMTNVSCGPAVTRYEMQPEMGVKVSKILSLTDDIKLNLAAADIRIEAPIPGKAAIGIEVPNKENSIVAFRDLVEDPSFINSKADLPFAVGKDIGGKVVVHDISKMPHLLVAGATGSGKSVCINTLIMSLLYKKRPEEVKLIMVDPKVVELNVYNGIPHLLIPVVTDPKKAAGALNWAVVEMMDRYEKFKQMDVRNLDGYNKKVEQLKKSGQAEEEFEKLPKIVIIVDELADLMMVAKSEVEDAIVRLSQLARAAGIHLVIATQRPSVDVITGLIKANVPSRIAFAVSSNVDSRTILDSAGAEKLLGKGDMLFYPTGYPKPIRVQGAFISDGEVNKVVEFLKEQSGPVNYDKNITNGIDENHFISSATPQQGGLKPERDPYFADAGRFLIEREKGSIGMLQRVYKVGFNRAARIMDQLCEAGVVGPEVGTKPRTILMTAEEFEEYLKTL